MKVGKRDLQERRDVGKEGCWKGRMQESKKTGKYGFRTENPFGAEHCQIKVNPFVALFWAHVIVLATSYPVLQSMSLFTTVSSTVWSNLVQFSTKTRCPSPPPPPFLIYSMYVIYIYLWSRYSLCCTVESVTYLIYPFILYR